MGQSRPLFLFIFVFSSCYTLFFQCVPIPASLFEQNGVIELRGRKNGVFVGSVTRLGDFLHFGNFFKPLATINLPKSLTFLGNFLKVSKSIIFLVKSFLGNFYRYLAIFIWSHCLWGNSRRKGAFCSVCIFYNQKCTST